MSCCISTDLYCNEILDLDSADSADSASEVVICVSSWRDSPEVISESLETHLIDMSEYLVYTELRMGGYE